MAHAVAVEGEDAAEALADEAEPETAEPEAGLGSAEGDDVAEPVDDAAVAHEVASGGTDAVETSDEPAADDSDEATAADDEASASDTAAVEGTDAAEALTADAEPSAPTSPPPVAYRESRTPTTIPTEVGQRVRQWIRRRTNR
ncbi:hypothetical protein MCHLDSM_01844 [Mycolicibacterium chlorophenolicum]|uniref:Uncharacterized protein n=1 Tax=Mycolicibacterium chlorophenolicum TaxID=37916 RepID=A0A0J6W615_9MYCO|nr:hypothetical protein MCHLDSM_01844 [Mycolicibacterium chlorophenolicum]